jgi:hypothetical protein
MAVFWDVALCILIDTGRLFRDVYCLHHQVGQYLPDCTTPTYQKTAIFKFLYVGEEFGGVWERHE